MAAPQSPWATRYGLFEPGNPFKFGSTLHSGFAPQQPSLHPKYPIDVPAVRNDTLNPNDEELDLLYMTEKYQNSKYGGYTTWQFVTFNRWVDFGPLGVLDAHSSNPFAASIVGNLQTIPSPLTYSAQDAENFRNSVAQLVFDRGAIVVDENKWFSFFQKNRWFNSNDYNVDDPTIWAGLQHAIELANRILQATIDDQHEALQTILFGRIDWLHEYRNDAQNDNQTMVLLSLRQDVLEAPLHGRSEAAIRGYMAQFGPVQWRQRLESVLSRVVWALHRWETASGWDRPDQAESQGLKEGKYTPICLGDRPFRALVDGTDLSLPEKCHIQYNLAVTLVHELMHAVLRGRDFDDGAAFNHEIDLQDRGEWRDDPVVDFEEDAEIGNYFEHQVFGGRAGLRFHAQRGGSGIALEIRQTAPEGIGADRWVMTSLHTSKLLSEAFWADASIPRKSDNFFHRNEIFRSGTRHIMNNPVISRDPQVQQTQEYKMLTAAYGTRAAIWQMLRAGWFEPGADRWDGTSWSKVQARKQLGAIPYWFNRRDEVSCASIANDLVATMRWRSHQAFVSELPELNFLDVRWIFHALGLLLMAAMPIRLQAKRNALPSWKSTITPSNSALQSGITTSLVVETTLEPDSLWAATNEAAPSVLYDPLMDNGRQNINDPLQYIFVLRRLINRVQTDSALVEEQWVKNLIAAVTEIEQKRRSGHFPPHTWIDKWPFVIPPYETRLNLVDWDPATAAWVVA
ncbi:hypothetical protein GGR57DRAFT_519650 [Xylariaceae sp. FL1272]|nr:hypothetical protein GGR57DRAFT_519650 [Xylariaceae sp. FL1272]